MAELNPRSVAIKNPTFSESVKLVLFARSDCQFGLRPCVVQAAGWNNAWNLRRPLYIRLWGDNSSLRLVFSNMCLCFPCNLTTSIPPHAPALPSTSQFFAVDTSPEITFYCSLFTYSFAQHNSISHAPFTTPNAKHATSKQTCCFKSL